MLESSLTNNIKKKLKKEVGGVWIKVHGGPRQRKGLPDLHGTVEGFSIWIEVKVPGNSPTKLQEETIKELNEKGKALAFYTTSVEDAVNKVKEYIERRDKGGTNRKPIYNGRRGKGNRNSPEKDSI